MKISEALLEATKILEENNIIDSKQKARRLLAYSLNKSKEYLMVHEDEEINEKLYNLFFEKINRLKENEPIQYILENQEFMGFDFYVDKNVLIPQPDTENLVEEVIQIANSFDRYEIKAPKILDLCTGSGAIAISLAKLIPNAIVYASDISKDALKIAEENSIKNCANVLFLQSDLFKQIFKDYRFEIIVSNPPYIKSEVISNLSKEVQKEPHLALDGGNDGLDFYREIAKESKKYLKEDGYLALEIGYDQRLDVEKILEENNFKNIYSRKDLSGNDRVVVAQK